jgi:pimeloyl-ACP methyl ester carboxylesterase
MPTIALSTGTVHYLEQGHGEPLILLHANPGDSRDFEAVMPTLAGHFRVLALDWPGYGGSAVPARPQGCDALFFYRVLREFIDAMGLAQVGLIGNSLGGNAAARLAIESPERVRQLVLVSPGGFTAHTFVTRAFCRLQGSGLSLSPRLWASLYLRRRTPTTRAMLARAATEQSEPPRRAVNRAVWRSFAEPAHDLRARAGRVQAPALLIFGRHDPAIPASKDGVQAARSMPKALGVTMPCGHAPFAEMPEQFLAEVLPFLRREIRHPHALAEVPDVRSRLRCTGVTPT